MKWAVAGLLSGAQLRAGRGARVHSHILPPGGTSQQPLPQSCMGAGQDARDARGASWFLWIRFEPLSRGFCRGLSREGFASKHVVHLWKMLISMFCLFDLGLSFLLPLCLWGAHWTPFPPCLLAPCVISYLGPLPSCISHTSWKCTVASLVISILFSEPLNHLSFSEGTRINYQRGSYYWASLQWL